MSNRNTPLHNRINSSASRNVRESNTLSAGLRHRIVSRPNATSTNENVPSLGNSQLLNTAFSASVTTTPSTSGPTVPRYKQKPTALNACYTPSSLYRNVKLPGSSTVTPKSTRSTNAVKELKNKGNAASIGDDTEISNLTVAVRVRPLNEQECKQTSVTNAVRVKGNELTVLSGTTADYMGGLSHSFTYDHVFYSCDPESRQYACQQTVFEGTAAPLISHAFEGYNACLFAYGQTGSGKSYSMMGIEALDDDVVEGSTPNPEAGIIPRFCRELFKRIDAKKDRILAEIEVSYFEIYNEKIHDMLCVTQIDANSGNVNSAGGRVAGSSSTPMHNQQQRQALKVREHPTWGPYVVDLSVHSVDSYEAVRNWLAVGNSRRATAATGMNDKSSRSHSIFNIILNLTEISDDLPISLVTASTADGAPVPRQSKRSKISLVDLAGSERITTSGADVDRMREGVSINKSLLTLGKVIAALSDVKKTGSSNVTTHVPYRESVLTWLLRENLGGNSKTVMLATISPASDHIDETLSTLRYACQARTIVNRVKVNESERDKTIRDLRDDVDRLKSLCKELERKRRISENSNPTPRKIIIETSVGDTEVVALRQELADRERELRREQKSRMERLKEAEDQRKSEIRLLKRKGLAFEISADQKQACLVNLIADPILSGTLFYLLPRGTIKIGRTRTSAYCNQPDIVLDGPLVAYHHCTIENENDKLYLTPENEDYETYLNGELVHCRQQMFHGDRLVIGGSHYFRISNPFCPQRGENNMVDFELAHEEFLHKQEEKLRRQLEEEKRVALSRIECERVENERDFKERMQKLEMEQLKFKCNREILETERKVLEEETAAQRTESNDALTYTPSFKSTLLEDINRIMNNPSEESLHKTQLMVKEATQRCRSVGLKLDFRQSKVLDEFGIFRTVVLIIDKEHERKAEWPTARLGVWLEMARECDDLNADNLFHCIDIEWQQLEAELNESLNDTLNSSRISLNLSKVKDVLLKQPFRKLFSFSSSGKSKNSPKTSSQQLTKSPIYNSTQMHKNCPKKKLTYDTEVTPSVAKTNSYPDISSSSSTPTSASNVEQNFATQAAVHVHDMQRSTIRLKRLCKRNCEEHENIRAQKEIRDSIQQLESILQNMRSCLEVSILVDNTTTSPSKTPKSLRFLLD